MRHMRSAAVIAVLLLAAACAATGSPDRDQQDPLAVGDLNVSISRGVARDGPILVVTISNVSGRAVCVRTEALQNRYSGEMQLRLRDSRGRLFGYRPSDLRPPAMEGVVRIEPGASARGEYDVVSRFAGIDVGRPLPYALSAQVAFRYGYCDDAWALQARSAWQPI